MSYIKNYSYTLSSLYKANNKLSYAGFMKKARKSGFYKKFVPQPEQLKKIIVENNLELISNIDDIKNSKSKVIIKIQNNIITKKVRDWLEINNKGSII